MALRRQIHIPGCLGLPYDRHIMGVGGGQAHPVRRRKMESCPEARCMLTASRPARRYIMMMVSTGSESCLT
jgi:hypothetical protein